MRTEKCFYNKDDLDEGNNINRILMNQKETEKFKGLSED